LLQLQRFRRDESGLQLVEVTIVVPMLLVLLAATAEFGRYFYEYTTLAKAARVGTRYLSTAPTVPQSDTDATNLVIYGNINGDGTPILPKLGTGNIKILRQGGTPVIPEKVTVQINGYKHEPIFDLGALINKKWSLNIDVKPSVTMRYLLTQPPPI
jgi:Flp pilus assembly protein TadG